MADAAQRRAYLQIMGIQPWVRRAGDAEVAGGEAVQIAAEPSAVVEARAPVMPSVSEKAAAEDVPTQSSSAVVEPAETVTRTDSPAPPAATPTESPTPPVSPASPAPTPPEPVSAPANPFGNLDWNALQTAVSQCTACELHATRTQAVFGSGDQNADWMIIGEAPGEDEDRQGEPFIGRAGQLLNNMLRAVDLSREQVYIANVIKCHPPGDRNPHVDEINQCFAYLQRQIELVQPKLILVVGRVAAHALLKVNDPLGKLRGQVHRFADVPLVVTYHPAYLLRKPSEKAKSWQDLRLARRVLLDAPGKPT